MIPKIENNKAKPCILQNGEYKGYFASATSLKNGMVNKGECECDNQVNPLKVPALVLAGGKNNILKKMGAKLGDLVIAYNSKNKKIVYAVVNDLGPANDLGEGSVLLNKLLLGKSNFPKNRKETYQFATPNDIIIALIPGSVNYKFVKPFTQTNIEKRVANWLKEAGFTEASEYISFVQSNITVLQ